MKKTYIIPSVNTTVIETAAPLLNMSDVTINRNGSVDATDVDVKSSSASSYNVWDDDWSE